MTLEYILWAFIIGVGAGTVYTYYSKRMLGGLVRKLLVIDACSPETAISIEKIDYKMNAIVKHALRKGTMFSETVCIDEIGNYYINPKDVSKAKIKYKNEGTSVFLLLLILIILGIVALINTYIFPEVLERFYDFISSFS